MHPHVNDRDRRAGFPKGDVVVLPARLPLHPVERVRNLLGGVHNRLLELVDVPALILGHLSHLDVAHQVRWVLQLFEAGILNLTLICPCLARDFHVGQARHIPCPIHRVREERNPNAMQRHVVRDVGILEVEVGPVADDTAQVQAHLLRNLLILNAFAIFGADVDEVLGA